MSKQIKSTFKNKGNIQSNRCVELFHIDLFGPIPITSLRGMKYTLVIIDDYSRYTWVVFLQSKDQTCNNLIKNIKRLQNEKSLTVMKIRSDGGTKFTNRNLSSFLEESGIKHELSNARTPQQNEVAERRNGMLKEAARSMIADANVSQKL